MFLKWVLAVLLFSTLGLQDSSVSSRVLVSSSSHLLEVPSFGFYGHAQCDKNGNLFFHGTSGSYNEPAVLELSSGSWEPTVFRVASDMFKDTGFEEFSVSPSGQVWMLGVTRAGGHYVFSFSSDGKMSGRTKLEVQDHLNI